MEDCCPFHLRKDFLLYLANCLRLSLRLLCLRSAHHPSILHRHRLYHRCYLCSCSISFRFGIVCTPGASECSIQEKKKSHTNASPDQGTCDYFADVR